MRIIEGFETFYLLNTKNMGRKMPTQFRSSPLSSMIGQMQEGLDRCAANDSNYRLSTNNIVRTCKKVVTRLNNL